jgi:uncharacterized RDD family membrane protein YckC
MRSGASDPDDHPSPFGPVLSPDAPATVSERAPGPVFTPNASASMSESAQAPASVQVSAQVPAHVYAGLVSRLIALAVDVALLTIVGLGVSVLPGLAWSQVIGYPPGWFTEASGIIASALPWAYFTVAWWLGGQTVGGLVVGARVTRLNGRRPRLVQAALRAFIGLLLVPVWLIGMTWVLWDPRRRAWHDIVFRTVVVRSPDLVPSGTSVSASPPVIA